MYRRGALSRQQARFNPVAKASNNISLSLSPRAALAPCLNGSGSEGAADVDVEARHFNVIWCKVSGRKHKKWEDDAVLVVRAEQRSAVLKDLDGKELARASGMARDTLKELEAGKNLVLGGKEVEIMEEIRAPSSKPLPQPQPKATVEATDSPALPVATNSRTDHVKVITKAVLKPFATPARFAGAPPLTPNASASNTSVSSMFNVDAPDALVMPRPPFEVSATRRQAGQHLTDVVVDPHLTRHLRPHQRQGVVFLYECIMGYRDSGGQGAILADEMGLGKTLQTISLVWTLLKQGPWNGRPVIRRALILSPSSLVQNWQAEFTKWLGSERISVYGVDASHRLGEYLKYPKVQPVLVMSYEMFSRSFDELSSSGLDFDLVVCDEGHRLKNDKVKAATLLRQLTCSTTTDYRRIVLTGTPVQNDLKEFYALVGVVNPNCLGSQSAFARKYEDPIVRSRQPEASEQEREEGTLRMDELNRLTGEFILRRTQNIISQYLPIRTEFVVFCQPTRMQASIYSRLLDQLGDSYLSDSNCVLSSIIQLRKICNHPSLSELYSSCPAEDSTFEEQGSKLAVVSFILHSLWNVGTDAADATRRREKIVLVSISTQVLDLLSEMCQFYSYPFLRLDGATSVANRQAIVDRFNSKHGNNFVLLLSSKAGGTGFNLIGASRILLYDMDWNPAHDLQAMARVWRDGQTRPVTVYRLVTTGTIEEKILQRQITKQGLALGVIESSSSSSKQQTQNHFTQDELKDLFTLRDGSDLAGDCDTHQLLECDCDGTGSNVQRAMDERKQEQSAQRPCQLGAGGEPGPEDGSGGGQHLKDLLLHYQHLQPPIGQLGDAGLHRAAEQYISYVFKTTQN